MTKYVIKNRVPSPEEMGRTLGLRPERVAELRRIMSSPSTRRTGNRSIVRYRAATAGKKVTAKRSESGTNGRGR